eukprot:gnl/TRDRNA2_/TRDRNA2_90006_c0_seq1.p2 gnl/TRDRNA2_/TRDRNA2_90006_c0~~gnl/TRDRNA2_/TRDRNA2_90006_c0_seq1.p2  ORF type:complete len:110 (-),score=31.51 gnl/TRDRNA2_/TRDRNA2_90006_c0_seq1:117-446(-)
MFWKLKRNAIPYIPQYKAAIWYHSDEQKQEIEKAMEARAASEGRMPEVDVLPAAEWHDAEEYHQKYYEKQEADEDEDDDWGRRLTAVRAAREMSRGGCEDRKCLLHTVK